MRAAAAAAAPVLLILLLAAAADVGAQPSSQPTSSALTAGADQPANPLQEQIETLEGTGCWRPATVAKMDC